MNRIILNNENISFELNDKIKYEYTEDSINLLKITITDNTKLEIYIDNLDEKKYQIQIDILDNISVDIVEIKKNYKLKALIKYNIGENSSVNITKINDINEINERNIIDLKGYNASINVILKTVCKEIEKYDIVIKHSYNNTKSNIVMDGINLSGNLQFNPTTYVENETSNCSVIQKAKIVNLSNNECSIKPGLLIDEKDTSTKQTILLVGNNNSSKKQIKEFIQENISLKLSNHYKRYWG